MSAPSLLDYVRRAFWFRPWGMPIPPNLFVLAAFGLLSLREPGFLLLGAGFETLWLLAFVTHPRFRALVDRAHAPDKDEALKAVVAKLAPESRGRFEALRGRCEALLEGPVSEALGAHHAEALGGLLQVYLQLLAAREGVERLVAEADPTVGERMAEAEARLDLASGELRASLEGQVSVLRQRVEGQREAARRLAYAEGELQRVEDQVELLREQAWLDTGAATVGPRIDAIAGALAQTRAWLADERVRMGSDEVPAPRLRQRQKVMQ